MAIQLIDFHDKEFKLNPAALDLLRSCADSEIMVVSVVGKARTGKSFLINQLTDNKAGFRVDSTVTSCTQGIWMWSNFRNIPGTSHKVIFIDSEGTSSVDRSTKTLDAKIFALIVLISSILIYNTTNAIDETGINELALASYLSQAIKGISSSPPKFIWLIRDFFLDKIDPDTHESISSKQYLEKCLSRIKTNYTHEQDYDSNKTNLVRETIVNFFSDRDCVALPRPSAYEEVLRDMSNVDPSTLSSDFQIGMIELKEKVFRSSSPKLLNGAKLTGDKLVYLLETVIQQINSGVIPDIRNTWEDYLAEQMNRELKSVLKILGGKSDYLSGNLSASISLLNSRKLEAYNKLYLSMIKLDLIGADSEEVQDLKEKTELKLQSELDTLDSAIYLNCKKNSQRQCEELVYNYNKDLDLNYFFTQSHSTHQTSKIVKTLCGQLKDYAEKTCKFSSARNLETLHNFDYVTNNEEDKTSQIDASWTSSIGVISDHIISSVKKSLEHEQKYFLKNVEVRKEDLKCEYDKLLFKKEQYFENKIRLQTELQQIRVTIDQEVIIVI